MKLLQHILRFAFVIGCVTQALAQTDSCLDRTIPVNVYTERGEVFAPLTEANFQASAGGKPIRVTSATYDSGPRRVLIVIDVSGSMTQGDALKCGLAFTHDLISLASPRDSLALLTFSTRIEYVVTFGHSQETLLAEVNKLQDTDWGRVKGQRKTALPDALADALTTIKSPSVGDAICVVSDGLENAGQSDWSSVKSLLESSGIRLYAFLPFTPAASHSRTPEAQGPAMLSGLASATGGEFQMFGPGSFGEFERNITKRVAQGWHNEVCNFQRLSVELPEPVVKPLHWKVEVIDASGRRNKHVRVVYPQRLAPCAP